jgi:hypothetical protein
MRIEMGMNGKKAQTPQKKAAALTSSFVPFVPFCGYKFSDFA